LLNKIKLQTPVHRKQENQTAIENETSGMSQIKQGGEYSRKSKSIKKISSNHFNLTEQKSNTLTG
jgi:hypothetical protein